MTRQYSGAKNNILNNRNVLLCHLGIIQSSVCGIQNVNQFINIMSEFLKLIFKKTVIVANMHGWQFTDFTVYIYPGVYASNFKNNLKCQIANFPDK